MTLEEITKQNEELQAELSKQRLQNSELSKNSPPSFYTTPDAFSTLSPVAQNAALQWAKSMNFTQNQFTQYVTGELTRAQREPTVVPTPVIEPPKPTVASGVFNATTYDPTVTGDVPIHEKLIEASVRATNDIIRDTNFSLSGVQLVSKHSTAAIKLNEIYALAKKHQQVAEHREIAKLASEYA